jgi:hypothetical protein
MIRNYEVEEKIKSDLEGIKELEKKFSLDLVECFENDYVVTFNGYEYFFPILLVELQELEKWLETMSKMKMKKVQE